MMRIESDLLGDIEVPRDALFGAQTQRTIQNFPVGRDRTIGTYPELIEGLLLAKQAAATANLRGGFLSEKIAGAIMSAAKSLLTSPEPRHFPVHRLHGGGGTSANMNANEVLANLAEESLGGKRGEYRIVHPNDHVNLHQSTNDVYPTACHIAIIRKWPTLDVALRALIDSLHEKAAALQLTQRIARTCLQDAVETSFADLFGGYAAQFERLRERTAAGVARLYAVNLGGTIVGRKSDVPESYLREIVPALREAAGEARYVSATNLFDAAQNPDDMVGVSADLDLLARATIKISKDLRLLSSGPETGFGEIKLPAMQPGSSIMPGKVNPVIPEFAIQLCFQTLGNHAACSAALDHGELDLNVWESTIVFNVLDSIDALSLALSSLNEKCIRGLEPIAERNATNIGATIPLLTRLMQQHGYSKISAICKEAGGDIQRIRELLQKRGLG